MEILTALFAAVAFGTVWGWVILIAAYVIITALVENDKGVWAFIAVVTSVLVLCKLHLGEVFNFIIANPGKVAMVIFGYFFIGTLWGVTKWFLFVNRELEIYNEIKSQWLSRKELTSIETSAQAFAFKQYIESQGYRMAPQVRDYKSDILLWMTYWPFSCLWTIVNDPIRRVFRSIYTQISTSLQSISDRMFRNATADLALAKEAEAADKERQQEKKWQGDSQHRR